MSESDGEQAARSVALEQAYVHDVYEQCAEKTAQSRHWPRIYKFLEELEPGALVCDIGCGNGKYLSVNDNVFKVGGDRCKRLTDIAREKDNEVLVCDNLALPFRDESFDAVLSIAVVHHFATTERRVNALKELARVLRIGGRLVISVWAMEQRHRKFESQDVLVPWPKAYCLNRDSSSGYSGQKTSAIPCINELDADRYAQKSLSTSKRNNSRKCKSRSYWIDPIFSPSPSTSSLSSPNETCYSFFRRALQKLAGGKRDSGNRAWFLETWQNGGCKNRQDLEIDDIGDVDDIPIELRRLEDDSVTMMKLPDAHSIKSKSLGDILEIQRLDLVRSRSSIPGFSSSLTSEFYLDEESKAPSPVGFEGVPGDTRRGVSSSMEPAIKNLDYRPLGNSSATLWSAASSPPPSPSPPPQLTAVSSPVQQPLSRSFSSNSKPRLVKQKTHIPDEETLDTSDKHDSTAVQECINGTDEIKPASRPRRGNVHKQSSMNEELMSMERLMERERVRRHIMKQASLNEEMMCKPGRTFGSFRDTIYSGNATKRFQLIKSGLTNRIKQSTTSMEKVSSMALKNGFVKILQGWKSGENRVVATADSEGDESKKCKEPSAKRKMSVEASTSLIAGAWIGSSSGGGRADCESIERRPSKEDGSDSSKDSSLQSDTSVDSEDSFASVIYVPKPQQQRHHNLHQDLHHEHQFPSLIDVTAVPVAGYQLRTTSAPPSPRIKHPPEIHGPRLKLISISPLLKQFPATSKSLPPPSPPRLSPRNFDIFGPSSNIDCPVNPLDASSIVKPTEQTSIIGANVNEISDCRNRFFTCEKNGQAQSSTNETIETIVGGSDDDGKTTTTVAVTTETTTTTTTTTTRYSLAVEAATELENRELSANIDIVDDPRCRVPIDKAASTVQRVNKPDAISSIESKIPAAELCPGIVNSDLNTRDNPSEKSSTESINEEDSRGSRLKQIKELLKQKPGFAMRCGKSSFPLVRRASTATSAGRPETIEARTLPRLLSLELFNPETDDLDSDSSGLSSPESIGSVISVISDERFTLKNKDKSGEPEATNAEVSLVSNRRASLAKSVSIDAVDEEKLGSASTESQEKDPRMKDTTSDVAQYANCEKYSRVHVDQVGKETAEDPTTIIASVIERYGGGRSTSLCLPEDVREIDQSSRIGNCKYSQLMDDTIAWLRGATGPENDNHYSEYTDNNNSCSTANEGESNGTKASLPKSTSEDTMDFVLVTNTGECIGGDDDIGDQSARGTTNTFDENIAGFAVRSVNTNINNSLHATADNETVGPRNHVYSRESTGEIGPSSDATDGRTGSLKGSKFCEDSANCPVSGNPECENLGERSKYLYRKRSASEETAGSVIGSSEVVDRDYEDGGSVEAETIVNGRPPSFKSIDINGSSSQESLLSDYGGDGFGDNSSGGGGGAITYHQYYHVFREGELDQLINKYVENLHIISSYYDHASWCIVAEKVQVWTI